MPVNAEEYFFATPSENKNNEPATNNYTIPPIPNNNSLNINHSFNNFIISNGIDLSLTIKNTKTSYNTDIGEYISATVNDDVYVNNYLLIKKGTIAKLKISQVERAKMLGIPGKITIADGKLTDVNGTVRLIRINREYKGKDKKWSKILCGFGIAIWPLLLFGLVKGNQGVVKQGIIIDAELVQ